MLWMGIVDMAGENAFAVRQMCEGRIFRLSMFLRLILARRKRLRKRAELHGVPEKWFHFPTAGRGAHPELHSLCIKLSKSQI